MPQREYLTLIPPLFPKILNYADYAIGLSKIKCGQKRSLVFDITMETMATIKFLVVRSKMADSRSRIKRRHLLSGDIVNIVDIVLFNPFLLSVFD